MKFDSIQDFKKNYAEVYHKEVVPLLKRLDKERKSSKSIIGFLNIILVSIILFGIWLIHQSTFSIEGVIFILSIIIVVIFFINTLIAKGFENKVKRVVMPSLMKAFGDFVWVECEVLDRYTLKETRLFDRFENKTDDDCFFGTYKGLNINIDETELTYTTRDSKGRRRTHTEFKGVIIEIDVKKPFKGHTIIRNREIINKKVYQEVKLEDPEFSRKYFVYATDQIESRFLLTTSFMERFKNIKNTFGGTHIQASFNDNKMIIAISTPKDLFKLGNLNIPITDTKPFNVLLSEFISILSIVDELKLNQNIGL